MWSVWRTVLEENEKVSKAKLAAIELTLQQIADEAKILRLQKLQTTKKVPKSTAISNLGRGLRTSLHCLMLVVELCY